MLGKSGKWPLTIAATATAFSLRLRLHYKAARAAGVKCTNMKKLISTIIIGVCSISAYAEKIDIKPLDCGPLDRGEYGVVFRVYEFPKGQTYFLKGKAGTLCPKLLSGNLIAGYEVKLPENKLFSESERVVIKEFVVTSYGEN